VSGAGGHPSDTDRERDALPVLEAVLAASRARDVATLAELYDEAVVWLAPDATVRGGPAALERHLAIAAQAVEWASPQQHGARAALRWVDGAGRVAAIVVEVRRGRIIFAAVA
jgi:ketosteroid isomerase-like protein